MKHILAALVVTTLLAGCGTHPATIAAPQPKAGMQTRTVEHVTHLYGDWIVGEVVAVKRTAVKGGERTQLTLDVREPSKVGHATGRLVVEHAPLKPAAERMRKGDVVTGFVSYPKIEAGRFVPGQVLWSHDLKRVDGAGR